MKMRMLLVGLLCMVSTLGCGDKPAPVAEPKSVVDSKPVAEVEAAAESPLVPAEQQALEFILQLGSESGSRQRYTFQVDRPGTVSVDCTWTGSAKVLTGILNGPVGGRVDVGSPIHMFYQVEEKHLAKSKDFSLSVVNFRGGEAQGMIRLSFPSDPRSISVTQVNQAYVKRVLSLPGKEKAATHTVFDKIDHATIAVAAFTANKVNGSNDENNQNRQRCTEHEWCPKLQMPEQVANEGNCQSSKQCVGQAPLDVHVCVGQAPFGVAADMCVFVGASTTMHSARTQ